MNTDIDTQINLYPEYNNELAAIKLVLRSKLMIRNRF